MPADVLVVDDQLATANKVARLIVNETGLESVAVDNPAAALEALTREPIKVVVLDQRMPQMSGTALMARLRALDDSVKVVMLTARASVDEVGEAIPMRLDHFVKKSNVSEVPSIVYDLYLQHLEESASRLAVNGGQLVASSRKYVVFGPRTDHRAEALKVLDPEYIIESEWRTVLKIDAGEERKYTEQRTDIAKFSIEEQSKNTLTMNLSVASLPLKTFSYKLEEVVDSLIKANFEMSVQSMAGIERTYRLPAEPADPSQVHISARHFQRAPVYVRALVRLNRYCGACDSYTVLPVIVLVATGKDASRHKDYYSNGEERTISTGIS